MHEVSYTLLLHFDYCKCLSHDSKVQAVEQVTGSNGKLHSKQKLNMLNYKKKIIGGDGVIKNARSLLWSMEPSSNFTA